jgi:hypothetical protein
MIHDKEVISIMMRPNPYLLLLSALEFTVADLAFNRNGELSPPQRQMLEQERLQHIERCVFAWIMLLIVGLILQVDLWIIVFGTLIAGWLVLGLWLRGEEDLHGGVHIILGRVDEPPGHGAFYNRYRLLVNGQTLMVSPRVKSAFQPGRAYRLYATAGSHRLLAAELAA